MQRLKRAIKKMAAITTGMAMLGATITSAVALDLKDYPSPFVSKEGVYDTTTAIVVGSNAAASDTLGAVDIATNLQYMAKTPVSGGGGVSVTGGVTEDIPIDQGIANSSTVGFDFELDDADISTLADTSIAFQGNDYDTSEVVVFSKESPSIETSLTSSDDDYESNIYLEAARDSIKYYYKFDEAINVSKATSSEPLEIKFLGKSIKVTNSMIDDQVQSKFKAYVGTEYFMQVGDTVTVIDKKVTLENVGSGGSIVINVDGTVETIPASTTETVNGIEITNDETFYEDTKAERSASLVIGEEAEATYADGDPYVGEDKNEPDWVWNIGNLGKKTSTGAISSGATITEPSGPYIGVENDFVKDDYNNDPAGIGECYDLPNNYVSVCFDSLTVKDSDYLTVSIEYVSSADTAKSGISVDANGMGGGTSHQAIYVHAAGDDRFVLPGRATDVTLFGNGTVNDNDVKTSEVWLAAVNATGIGIFYKDKNKNPNVQFFGACVLNSSQHSHNQCNVLHLNYENTKSTNVNISIQNFTGTQYGLFIDVNGDSTSEIPADADNIMINFTKADGSGNWSSLGATLNTEEAEELLWKATNAIYPARTTAIGKKDEDQRTIYGIIIKDPKSNGAGDNVVLEIPADDVQANVIVKGTAATVTGGAVSYIPADITVATKLDTEITDSKAYNLILVGGPCADPLVEEITGLPTCAGWELASGEALIKLVTNGDKVALLVAGTTAIDTRMAAKVIANYDAYKLETTEAIVTGTLSAPSIKVA